MSGEAINSDCRQYEAGGAITLVFLFVSLSWLVMVVIYGIWTRRARWEGVSIKEAIGGFKEGVKEAWSQPGVRHKLQGTHDRCEPVVTPHPHV